MTVTGLARLLRLLSTLACAFVLVSFALWAIDEGRAGSRSQVSLIEQKDQGQPSAAAPNPPAPAVKGHGGIRGAIDDVNAQLVSPFDSVAGSGSDKWVQRGVPALLALLVYGLVARLLIAYLPARR
jgi:hypothetical protein